MEIKAEKVTPYGNDRPKGAQVEEMFDNIAPAYDFMNRAMTLGIDRLWRRRVVGYVAACAPGKVLDVATGTGDLAIAIARKSPQAAVSAVDLSEGMLAVARRKVADASLQERILLSQGDCMSLPFADGEFDVVTAAFGVRNFEDLERGFAEMARVLRPGGRMLALELTVPMSPLIRPLYNLYTRRVIPMIGRMVSKDQRAYSYLPESIAAMPQGDRMLQLIKGSGFSSATREPLTLGVSTVYTAIR